MRQIRIGLEKNLDVLIYAKEELNYLQMEQIRIGLEQGLRVEVYSKVKYDSDKMF